MTTAPPETNAPALVDTHCHVAFDVFDDDRTEVIERAKQAGVVHLVTIGAGAGLEGTRAAIALAESAPDYVSASAGVHPHDAGDMSDVEVAELESLARSEHVVAIGETGLDHFYDLSPRTVQERRFRDQIEVAKATKKPLIIHTRDAADLTLRVLAEQGAREVGGIIHCFSEDAAFAKRALDMGFVAAFSGLVTFKKGTEAIQEAARAQPADSILVETDAPYLAPTPHRGKRNEPAYVAKTAGFLAALRGLSLEEFAAQTTANAARVFALGSKIALPA